MLSEIPDCLFQKKSSILVISTTCCTENIVHCSSLKQNLTGLSSTLVVAVMHNDSKFDLYMTLEVSAGLSSTYFS